MTEPGWHPDPGGQFEYRYWDGATWTDQVSTAGQTYTQPLPGHQPTQISQAQVSQARVEQTASPVELFTSRIVIMIQTGKKNEFTYLDENELVLGHIGPDPSGPRMAPKLNVGDAYGRHVVQIIQNTQRIVINAPEGCIGELKQKIVLKSPKLRYEIIHGDAVIGMLEAKSWTDDHHLDIFDSEGAMVAELTKVRLESDSIGKRLSNRHDRYIMVVHHQMDPTLRALATFTSLMFDVNQSKHR